MMLTSRPRRPCTLAVGAGTVLVSLAGCGSVWSTDGRVFQCPGGGHAMADALQASASHDIPCPIEQVRIVAVASDGNPPSWTLVQGCGESLTYGLSLAREASRDYRVFLVARSKVK